MNKKNWTKEEENYLAENWGTITIDTISKNLNRSHNAIIVRSQRLSLGAYLESGEYVTFHQLLLSLGYTGGFAYAQTSWIKNRGCPVRNKKVRNNKFQIIYLNDFWEWAEKNQHFLDFKNFERYSLGEEPEWVNEKRIRDRAALNRNAERKKKWTEYEDSLLISMCNQQRLTVMEIADRLSRTEGAVVRRINDLKIPCKPPIASKQSSWTSEEIDLLGNLIRQGYSYEAIHEKIPNKSTKAIRGYVYRLYLTENLDKVKEYIGIGKFGDNTPEKKLKHIHYMTPEERFTAKQYVSNLTYLLNQRARQISSVSEEYKDYWQKNMCANWDDILGCTADEKSCDSCSHFIRIKEQYCIRCGATIIDRKKQTLCEPCKMARIKQAQKKWAVLHRINYCSV